MDNNYGSVRARYTKWVSYMEETPEPSALDWFLALRAAEALAKVRTEVPMTTRTTKTPLLGARFTHPNPRVGDVTVKAIVVSHGEKRYECSSRGGTVYFTEKALRRLK